MSLVTFIKRPTHESEDGTVRIRNYKRAELVTMLREDSGKFLQVPESHANAVLRQQRGYQEVYEDVIAEAKAAEKEPVTSASPADNTSPTRPRSRRRSA